MYLESYMSRVLDIPKYRANKDKDKINLVYFIRFIHLFIHLFFIRFIYLFVYFIRFIFFIFIL